MANRTDLEYKKFVLSSGHIKITAVSGVGPATTVFGNIDQLEKNKLTPNGEIRTIITF